MSDSKSEPGKLIKVKVEECEHGTPHVTETSVEDVTIHRSADGVRIKDSEGSTVGYSAAYAANWDANFAEKCAACDQLATFECDSAPPTCRLHKSSCCRPKAGKEADEDVN